MDAKKISKARILAVTKMAKGLVMDNLYGQMANSLKGSG